MDPKKAYKFCPKCSGGLVHQKGNLLKCSLCNFHFYINPLVCNAVILENKKGEILLVKRRFPPKKGFWDLPGGFIQPDETLTQSVKREIKEELNVDIAVNHLVGSYPDRYLYQGISQPTLNFVVSATIKKGKPLVKDDVSQLAFFSKKTVLRQKIAFEGVRQGLKDYLRHLFC